MAIQRYTIKLTQLRCIRESDPGASEPYLWVTYFALGAPVPPFQTGPLAVNTPSFDAFRTEFANNVSAGSVVGIPTFIASASFDMESSGRKLLGCVAVLMEEDETRQRDIILGRIAYSKEIESQLNALMRKRIQMNDGGPLTESEKETIRSAVKSKVTSAVGSQQSFFNLARDQDDVLGFTHKIFPDGMTGPIETTTFDFPEITKVAARGITPGITDRYILSGQVTVEAVGPDTTDHCAGPRAALASAVQRIQSLQHRVTLLQQQLHNATPQQKSGIVQQITATNAEIDQLELQLPALEATLKNCTGPQVHIDPTGKKAVPIG